MRSLFIYLLLDVIFLYTSLYDMQMLQQNAYDERSKYFHFVLKDFKNNYFIFLLRYFLAFALMLYDKFNVYLYIFLIVVLIFLCLWSIRNQINHNKKLPLKYTKRLIRILLFDYILFIALELIVCKVVLTYFAAFTLMYIAIHPIILMIIVLILSPVEKMIMNHYKNNARNKLKRMNNLNVIGITGSFGKTSTKNILNSILKTTYTGFITPSSFNTPSGLTLTIQREKSIFNDYFIAEMGARYMGEIKELCDIVYPKYGILTSIGPAHLETFKSLDNICKTKFELIESLPSDGVGVLNKDDEYMRKYHLKNNCNIIWIGIDNKADVMAENIKVKSDGTTFDIVFNKTKERITVNTILLGNKNIYNILASAALSKYLNVSNENIIRGIKNIEPINHRLELKRIGNITLIDDSFNSNPVGAKNAVDVLGLMDGEKVIITPGMVEMGKEEDKLNYTFGEQMSDVCNHVYLVGPKKTKPIYDGLLSKGYNVNDITVCKSFNEAYDIMSKDYKNKKVNVLIENDLPDSYTEA